MNNYREYLTRKQHQEIIQRINDTFGEDYLQAHEFGQIYEEFANSLIHEDDDNLYINNI
ncbi:hypothetical protein [Staphylococcus sp. LCT-H4]|uniref:hypothetical protein n=1 Tax=Staphylococcus sp. LCT-H4 TaxID=1914308 RepID=UPI0015A60575|nr:hypothetical protein [Staphylococcus sp. LCT-H4]